MQLIDILMKGFGKNMRHKQPIDSYSFGLARKLRKITPIIIRKRLMIDSDQREMARVKEILDKSDIPYTLKTLKEASSVTRGFESYARLNYALSYSNSSRFTYVIYVRKKDFAKANELCYHKKR